MRIPTGNFGHTSLQVQTGSAPVANTSLVSNAIGAIGSELHEQIQSVANARAGGELLDYQMKIQSVSDSLRQSVEDGTLKADQLDSAYQEAISKIDPPQLAGVGLANAEVAQQGIKRAQMGGLSAVQSLYHTALRTEAKDLVDTQLDQLGKMTNAPGADVEKINAMSSGLESQGRLAYGAQWAKVRQSWVDKNWFNHAQQQLMNARENGGELKKFNSQLTAKDGFYIDKLDPDRRNALLNQAMGYQSRLEAKAIAAQNHADMISLKRENAAARANTTMQMRIANGEIPADSDWNTYLQTVAGTSQAGDATALKSALVETQRLYGMAPDKAQQQIDNLALHLKKNGGTEVQYKVLNAVQRNIDKRLSDLRTNPQAVGAMDSGQPLQPLSPGDALQQPGAWGQGLVERQINSDAIAKKYGATAGKNLLTPDELHNTQDAYEKMTADHRVQFWRNTQASSSPMVATRLAREIGGGSNVLATVAAAAGTPQGYKTALTIEQGRSLLNPRDGAAKVKAPKTDDVTAAIKSEYPNLSQSQIQNLVTAVTAYHVGAGKSDDDIVNRDTLHAVIGEPVKVFGARLVAPPGTDAENYSRTITSQVNRLDSSAAANVRNHLENGSYSFIPDVDGNLRLINASTNRIVTINGSPFVVEVNQ